MGRKVALRVFGCKVNQNEAWGMAELFRQAGYEIVDFNEPADVYVIHTCTVTRVSDRKCRQAIRRAARVNPQAVIAVTGCYAQTSPQEVLAIPGVDVVVGTGERRRIVELVERVIKGEGPLNVVRPAQTWREYEELPVERWDRARAMVKVQEGCDEFCTYCIIPYARGPARSRDPENAVSQVRELVASGYREIVLTGVHLGAYGKDKEGIDLAGLVERLARIPGLARLRLSSLEPVDFSSRLLDVVTTTSIICPHFHVPLQSGADAILERMGRPYRTADYAGLVARLRQARPEAAITTDVIAGFPGETDAHFAQTMQFIEEMAFSRLHVFPYSPRRGTPAAGYQGQVPAEVKEERTRTLAALSRRLAAAFAGRFTGQVVPVLVERRAPAAPGWWEGHTPNYLLVRFPADPDLDLTGELVEVKLEKAAGEVAVGGGWRWLAVNKSSPCSINGPSSRCGGR